MADGATALVLDLNADTRKSLKALDALTQRLDKLAPELEAKGKRAMQGLERGMGGVNVGKAFQNIFDSAKLATLEEGSTKLRIFGSALEPLGPLGLAAAGGVAAFGLALEEAHKAVEFADSLYKLAKGAHVTTDELQEMQFALRVAGGNAADAAPALTTFSETLGKASAGAARALRPFKQLFGESFSAADAKRLIDSGHALETVTEAISNLSSTAQKDASVQQFGLEGLKLLIEEGPEKMREFRAEAEASGNVMDSHLVRRGHELNEEIETATGKIKVQLAEAFVNIGPLLLKLIGYLSDMATLAEKVSAAMAPLEARGTTDLNRELHGMQARQAQGGMEGAFYNIGGGDDKRIARIQAELARRKASGEDLPPKLPTGGGQLADLTKHKQGPRDDTSERADQVAATLATADKARLSALAELTHNIQAKADYEKQALTAEVAAEDARLQKQIDEIAKDKGIPDSTAKDRLKAQLELAKLENDQTATIKAKKIDDDAILKITDLQYTVYKDMLDAQIAQLEAQAAMATDAKTRRDIEARILDLRQQEERDLKGAQIDRDFKQHLTTEAQHDQQLKDLGINQAAQTSQFALAHEDPVQQYLRSVQDLNTEFETDGVEAVKSLSTGLADAIVNAKSLGDVASNVFKQLIAQLLAAAIQKDVAAPIIASFFGSSSGSAPTGSSGGGGPDPVALALKVAGSFFGFADGTNSAPGGLAWVGERGPELVNLPRGSQVMPHFQSLEALRSMAAPKANNTTIVQPFHFHAEGAVLTQELLAQANDHANRAAAGAAQYAQQASAKDRSREAYAGRLNA